MLFVWNVAFHAMYVTAAAEAAPANASLLDRVCRAAGAGVCRHLRRGVFLTARNMAGAKLLTSRVIILLTKFKRVKLNAGAERFAKSREPWSLQLLLAAAALALR